LKKFSYFYLVLNIKAQNYKNKHKKNYKKNHKSYLNNDSLSSLMLKPFQKIRETFFYFGMAVGIFIVIFLIAIIIFLYRYFRTGQWDNKKSRYFE